MTFEKTLSLIALAPSDAFDAEFGVQVHIEVIGAGGGGNSGNSVMIWETRAAPLPKYEFVSDNTPRRENDHPKRGSGGEGARVDALDTSPPRFLPRDIKVIDKASLPFQEIQRVMTKPRPLIFVPDAPDASQGLPFFAAARAYAAIADIDLRDMFGDPALYSVVWPKRQTWWRWYAAGALAIITLGVIIALFRGG